MEHPITQQHSKQLNNPNHSQMKSVQLCPQLKQQSKEGRQVVNAWVDMSSDELLKELMSKFPESQQAFKQMSQGQIKQIVQQIYNQLDCTKSINKTVIDKAQQKIISNQKQDSTQGKSRSQLKGEQMSSQAIKAKIIDLLPDIRSEVQSMQYQALLQLYTVVMEELKKALPLKEPTNNQPLGNPSPQQEPAIDVDQRQADQMKEQTHLESENHWSLALHHEQNNQPRQEKNTNFIVDQPQFDNLKRNHQQMSSTNPSSNIDTQYLRERLRAKLPHLKQYIATLTTAELTIIYEQSLLAQTHSKEGKKRINRSHCQSERGETDLFELKEVGGKTLILRHTEYLTQEGTKIKKGRQGTIKRSIDQTFRKICKVLSKQ